MKRTVWLTGLILTVNIAIIAIGVLVYPTVMAAVPFLNTTTATTTDTTATAADQTTEPTATQITFGNRPPAWIVMNELLQAAPKPAEQPDSTWTGGHITTDGTGWPLDSACPTTIDSTTVPVLTGQRTWTTRTTTTNSTAVAYNIRIVPAGLGPAALNGITTQARECEPANLGWTPGTTPANITTPDIDANTIGYTITGPDNTVHAIIIQTGDILGLITTNTTNINLTELATRWTRTWNTIVNPTCENTTDDTGTKRQPLHPNYTGYVYGEPFSLSHSELATLNEQTQAQLAKEFASGTVTLPNGATATTNTGMPYEPATHPEPAQNTITLTTIPTGLTVTLPPNQPEQPTPPTLASLPDGTGTIWLPKEDTTGPGCGWTFTNQTPPLFAPDGLDAARDTAQTNEVTRLSKAYTKAVRDQWTYQLRYTTYTNAVTTWNTWATEANNTIATAAWTAYDTATTNQPDTLAAYHTKKTEWETCRAANAAADTANAATEAAAATAAADPTNPTPAPTPTLIPTKPCGKKPTPPTEPTPPTMPRPANVPEPGTTNSTETGTPTGTPSP